MQIQMTVFSVDDTKLVQRVTLPDGGEADATVAGKRVQLTSTQHGTMTLNLSGAQARDWTKAAGDTATVTIE